MFAMEQTPTSRDHSDRPPLLDSPGTEDTPNKEVHYLQSQNGNLFTNRYYDMSGEDDPSEFEPLREYVPSEIPWCSDALGASRRSLTITDRLRSSLIV